MRHFAERLHQDGWQVDYVRLDDADNSGSFTGEVRRAIARHEISRVVVTGARRVACSEDDHVLAG